MKTMLTMQEAAREVARVRDSKTDYVADTRRLGFHANGGRTVDLDVPGEGTLGYELTRHAEGQVAGRLGIPRKFWDRLAVDHPDILTMTVSTLFQREPEERMLRTLDGKARAFLSNGYRRIDNADLLEAAILPTIAEMPDARIESIGLTETRLYLKVVLPRVEGEVNVGDVVQSGFVVSNSEVGAGSLSVEQMLYRLICKNGMIVGDAVRRRHVGRRVEAGDDGPSIFSDETMQADDHALMLKVRDLVRAAASESAFQGVVAGLRDLAGTKVEGDPVKAVERLADRHSLSDDERGSVLSHLVEGGDLSAWGYVNAVTRTANDADDYDRATELERLGGVLTALPAQDWRLN